MHQDLILPKSIYYFFILIIILVLPIALGLIFLPQQTGPAFFWPLKPFNTRFLGFFYTAEMAAVGLLIKYNRWSPARFVITASFLFTLWATLLNLENRPMVWALWRLMPHHRMVFIPDQRI